MGGASDLNVPKGAYYEKFEPTGGGFCLPGDSCGLDNGDVSKRCQCGCSESRGTSYLQASGPRPVASTLTPSTGGATRLWLSREWQLGGLEMFRWSEGRMPVTLSLQNGAQAGIDYRHSKSLQSIRNVFFLSFSNHIMLTPRRVIVGIATPVFFMSASKEQRYGVPQHPIPSQKWAPKSNFHEAK